MQPFSLRQTGRKTLTLIWQPKLKKENCEFKLLKIRSKSDLVLHPAREDGLVKKTEETSVRNLRLIT